MEAHVVYSFLHLVFVGFVSLFPPVNPVGSALIVEPFLAHTDHRERLSATLKIAFYCFMICVVSSLFGGIFFDFFGISLPVVQMAGGILICRMGFGILYSEADIDYKENEKEFTPHKPARHKNIKTLLFFPLAFPTTTGAGTISVLLALSANSYDPVPTTHLSNLLALIVACFLMCVLVFVCYYFAPILVKKTGVEGHQILNRFSGFLTFCVGLQIFVTGLKSAQIFNF